MFQFSLRQLSLFAETAKCGGIARAARNMSVSPAAVASAIDKLEDTTGLVLFDRFPARGMRLTPIGAEFLADAEALLAQSRRLAKHATDLAAGDAGSLRLGTHHAVAQNIVLPAVLALRESHPGVRIEIVEDEFDNLTAALDNGEVDALVVFDQGFDPLRHRVETLKVLDPIVLLPAAHPLAKGDRIEVRDLTDLPYINVSSSGPGQSYLDMLRAAGLDPEVPLSSRSRELAQAYVGKGLGFTLVAFPPRLDVTIEGDHIAARPLKQSIGTVSVVIAQSRGGRLTRFAHSFLQACRAQI